jgi:glycine dehydrogenase subunit 2
MIEPPETECKEDLDVFIDTIKTIVNEAREHPELLHEAPVHPKVRRLDETTAARHPCLRG